MIREIEYEELKAASDVLWKSFYHAEKNNHSMAGMECFRDMTDSVSLAMNTFDGNIVLYGCFENDLLLAVGALKEKKHVLMLYVLPEHQNRGIGKKLLQFMESECFTPCISLNASDCAIPFYEHNGYLICGKRSIAEGLISTPMKKSVKK